MELAAAQQAEERRQEEAKFLRAHQLFPKIAFDAE